MLIFQEDPYTCVYIYSILIRTVKYLSSEGINASCVRASIRQALGRCPTPVTPAAAPGPGPEPIPMQIMCFCICWYIPVAQVVTTGFFRSKILTFQGGVHYGGFFFESEVMVIWVICTADLRQTLYTKGFPVDGSSS